MAQIIAPNLGQSGMDVTIETWFKADGEHVEKGEVLYELSNEKLTQEIEAPASGTLKIVVQEGDSVAPGGLVGELN